MKRLIRGGHASCRPIARALRSRWGGAQSIGLRRGCYTKPILARGQDREPLKLQPEDRLHGFVVQRVQHIPERNLNVVELQHEATGAHHLHVDTADTNNVFAVTFKTTPQDSTGVAHVLEHTSLCGSKRFPVRDPFFNMLNRSLNTYMNAWTSSDWTMYPFSTLHAVDYHNLMSVYLDASFFPNLDYFDFLQEGHRLEFDAHKDSSGPKLVRKGVVYNEMKGAMGDASSLYREHLYADLFPTLTYGHNSGGDPRDIPKLTWDALRDFHATHYHPSNAWFYTYGDLPLEDRLRHIHEGALSTFGNLKDAPSVANTSVGLEQRRTTPGVVRASCPPTPGADPERQAKAGVAWLTHDITDARQSLAMQIMSTLLTSGPNSPLYKALIDSRLGQSYAPCTGLDTSSREAVFGAGLMGLRDDDVNKVEDMVLRALEGVVRDGFDRTNLASLLHQIELGQKHVTTMFGLQMGSDVISPWIHGGDPIEHLHLDPLLESFKQDQEENGVLERLVREQLLENQHRLTIVTVADPDYTARQEAEEEHTLAELANTLTEEERATIAKESEVLQQRQEGMSDTSCLPTMTMADIPKQRPRVDVHKFEASHASPTNGGKARASSSSASSSLYVQQPTNGLTYVNMAFDLSELPKELVPFVPLFSSIVTSVGTGSLDHRAMAQQVEMYTSGIRAIASCSHADDTLLSCQTMLRFRTAALQRNLSQMTDLLLSTIEQPRWDEYDHIASVLDQCTAAAQDSLVQNGHSFARYRAAAAFGGLHTLVEQWEGVTAVNRMQQLVDEGNIEYVANQLAAIARHLTQATTSCRVLLTCEQEHVRDVGERCDAICSKATATTPSFTDLPTPRRSLDDVKADPKCFLPLPVGVNYVAKTYAAVPYTHEDSITLALLAQLMTNAFLHREIREKGGAYGGGASCNGSTFSFHSYRDPNVDNTLAAFADARTWLHSDEWDDNKLLEAKLALFSRLDQPLSPSSQGLDEFRQGTSYETRERRRAQLFDLSREDMHRVVDTYLSDDCASSVCVLGSDQLAKEYESREGWMVEQQPQQ